MKKIILFSTAALMMVAVAFANTGDKGKSKKCAKGKSCCTKDKAATAEKKSCCKDKADKTVKM